jgi:hypothetical protein
LHKECQRASKAVVYVLGLTWKVTHIRESRGNDGAIPAMQIAEWVGDIGGIADDNTLALALWQVCA